jgi:hypothetical protein
MINITSNKKYKVPIPSINKRMINQMINSKLKKKYKCKILKNKYIKNNYLIKLIKKYLLERVLVLISHNILNFKNKKI